MTWTEDQIKKLEQSGTIQGYRVINTGGVKPVKKSKYGNKKVTVDGIEFDSKKEASRYFVLKEKQLAGKISGLMFHHVFELEVNGTVVAKYEADFTYTENGKLVVEDVKSAATRINRVYRLKNKLMFACHGIKIKEV